MAQLIFSISKDAGTPQASGSKVYRAIASTAALDRDKEVLVPLGVQIENFMKNPVMLHIHQQRQVPVGKVTSITVNKDAVEFSFEFAPTETGKEVQSLYDLGFMSAFSVGFYPKSYMWIEDTTPKQMELTLQNGLKWNMDLTQYKETPRAVITDWELLEISPVPVPSNPEALLQRSFEFAIQKSVETTPGSDKFARMQLQPKFAAISAALAGFLKSTEDFKLSGCVPVHATPVDKESAWDRMKAMASLAKKASSDGSGAKDTIDFGFYASGFAWFNPSKTSDLISYKLMHHHVDEKGELVANLKAVQEAMAKLLGDASHGGVDSDDDLKDCHAHLAKHYQDAGVLAPEFKLDYTAEQVALIAEGKSLEVKEEPAPEPTAPIDEKQSQLDLQKVLDAIKSLESQVSEVGEGLGLRMGILLNTVEEIGSSVGKSNTVVEQPTGEVDPKVEDAPKDAPEGVLLDEFKQAAEMLKSFVKTE